jgi:hypothetical protein
VAKELGTWIPFLKNTASLFTFQSRPAAVMASAEVAALSNFVPNPCQGVWPTYIIEFTFADMILFLLD